MKYRIEYETEEFNIANIDNRKTVRYGFEASSDADALQEFKKFQSEYLSMPYGRTYRKWKISRIDQVEKSVVLFQEV